MGGRIKALLKRARENITRLLLVVFFVVVALVAIGLEISQTEEGVTNSVVRFAIHALINVAPELAGIAIGVVTIDYLNEKRQGEQLKRQLILQMGSRHNDVTDTAVRTLAAYGWITDGSLQGAYLWGADLSKVILSQADLSRAELSGANLSGANLVKAKLLGADLSRANLVWANLPYAGLVKAKLLGADLSKANLAGADLSEADLFGANLSEVALFGANLSGADLLQTDLSKTDLSKTDLSRVNLSWANLSRANLYGANLSAANLSGANLSRAEHWTIEQLLRAASLENATMPDGRQYENWVKDLEVQAIKAQMEGQGQNKRPSTGG